MNAINLIRSIRRLFHIQRNWKSVESPSYLFKWLFISTLIGIGTGIGIIIFYEAIRWFTIWGLGFLVGYIPPEPAGEGSSHVMTLWSAARPWILPLVTMMGGLIAGIIVFALAPEAEGHGTDATITGFHQGRSIRWRTPVVKLFTSALIIGTGGSSGPEGPAGQIGAGFGSILSRLLHLNAQDRRIALASGMGAGIGAIFRAPLGGAVLAAEILYRNDLEVEVLIPSLISSIISYSIFGAWVGWNPIYALSSRQNFTSPLQLIYYGILGLLCGGVGILMAEGFHSIETFFTGIKLPFWLKPALGGLGVGLIGLTFPQIIGTGYGWIQVEMGTGIFSISLLALLMLPFLKILTTGLSVGSGGPGGLFGPGMVVGGMLGAVVWRVGYHFLPGLISTPAPFIIVGMMALFGSISRSPLAMMLMVAEMTGNLSLLAPAMIAVGIAYLVVGQHTMYPSQPDTHADSPAHRLQLSFPLLATLTAEQAMKPLTLTFHENQTVEEAWKLLEQFNVHGAPVLGNHKRLIGVLTSTDIQRVSAEEQPRRKIGEIMTKEVLSCSPETPLANALEEMTTARISWMPVVDDDQPKGEKHVIGLLTVANIMQTYRATLKKGARHMKSLIDDTVMVETTVSDWMRLAGCPLREAQLPKESLVVSIRRQGELIFPQGGTIIQPGDVVTFLVNPRSEDLLHAYLSERKIPEKPQPTNVVVPK